MPKVVNTIKALKEGGITVSALIIDGADMSKISAADLKTVSDFVQAEKITAWFSDTNESKNRKDRGEEKPEAFSGPDFLAL